MIFLTSSYPTMVLKSSADLWNNDREKFGNFIPITITMTMCDPNNNNNV
jgi:hypothetical protein